MDEQGHIHFPMYLVFFAVIAMRCGGRLVRHFVVRWLLGVKFKPIMDGEIFNVYIERVLAPTLRGGDVVVMDNLSAHKRPQVKHAVEAAGAALLYLPPYSPDFNPIEMIWSKVKRLLRSFAARTVDALHEAFGRAFAAVTRADILGCFRHCGYDATANGARL